MATVCDGLAEGVLNRLVAQVIKGRRPRERGSWSTRLRIDNASPMISTAWRCWARRARQNETPKVLTGICVSRGGA